MKKLIVILALVAVACAPAFSAPVTISCVAGATTGTISYSVSGPNSVRAFALDVTVNNGKAITAVTCSNSSYYIYPGSISISAGSVQSYGRCDCNGADWAAGTTQPGLNSTGVTVEMGSLYTGGSKPATTGGIIVFTVTTPTTATINVNSARGGVVMENPDESPGHNMPLTIAIPPASSECLKNSAAEYNSWGSFGKPDCWCFRKHCRGDADGTKAGVFRVSTADLNILRTGWNKTETWVRGNSNKGICADFDHTKAGSFRVSTSDLNILRTAWNKNDSSVKCCDADQNCTLDAGDKWDSWKGN